MVGVRADSCQQRCRVGLVAREARQYGLTGWVKNKPDGSVEMVVEGEEDQVKDFLAWAQTGPSTSRVDKIETKWRSYTGEFSEFRIVGSG